MNWPLIIFLLIGIGLALLVMRMYGVSQYLRGREEGEAWVRRGQELDRDLKAGMRDEEVTHAWDRGYARGLKDQHDDPNAYYLYFKTKEE
jgi:hypothetical protein